MNSPIIADTSALMSLVSENDSNHKRAIKIAEIIEKKNQKVIIPGEIITEFLNVVGKKAGHTIAIEKASKFTNTDAYDLKETIEEIRRDALQKFKNVPGSVSYTDCIVMTFADHFETKIILGFNEVFVKSGYQLPT